MLRVKTKECIISILKKASLLCEKVMLKDNETVIATLQDVQDAVIVAGECMEKELEDLSDIISRLEALCEMFYLLSMNLDNREGYGKHIQGLLKETIECVSNLPAGYQVVFFPYKADMWDSLESIWLACKEDPLCDCKVVPIPYYHFDASKNEWVYCYEIERFPEQVPVIHYKEYRLDERADAAFIHNPYDEYNHVTHVYSDFYSYNLKKYVQNLFYVPYYVTSGFISDDHKYLSAYQHADCLVVQSKAFKEGLKDYGFDAKALVAGSPKLDRVVRMSVTKREFPDEWKDILGEKKTLMLNTSIGQFLNDGEGCLRKLKYIFEVIKRRDDVVIVWRPHPLLLSTIESMRPHLLSAYENLKKTFLDNQVGILDTSPDITHTVAAVDGYIGENASSVINLFEAAGKPLFILNNYVLNDFSKDEAKKVILTDCYKVGEKYYCTIAESSAIFEVELSDWTRMKKKADLPYSSNWGTGSGNGAILGDKIYSAPIVAEEFVSYDIKKNVADLILKSNKGKILNYRFAVAYNDKVFYLPNVTKCITQYDTVRDNWTEHYEPIKLLQKDITARVFEDIASYCVNERWLWICALYTNRILRFDMENGKYKIYNPGTSSAGYSAITVSNDIVYLADAETGVVFEWDYKKQMRLRSLAMPMEYEVSANYQGRKFAHLRLYKKDKFLYAIPGRGNGLVQIDLKTGKSVLIAKEFWKDVREEGWYYSPIVHNAVCFVKRMDDVTLLVQKRRDASLLEVNLETGEYSIHYPRLAPGELEKMLDGEDGFEKLYTNGEFARRESRYFSFEGFLDDLVNNRFEEAMERQKKEMETMAVNLDGTCGEKVHEFLMKILVD